MCIRDSPNTERLRDWISIPKSNGYESLHTTVSAGGGRCAPLLVGLARLPAGENLLDLSLIHI